MDPCQVCGREDGKYKCPFCKKIRYCSIQCNRIHKAECSGLSWTDPAPLPAESPDGDFAVFRSNKEIVNALADKRLQQIIRRIDTAANREGELEMEINTNYYFKEFVEKLLRAAPKTIKP